MSWVYLDDNFFNHPKARIVGTAARELYIQSLAYANQQMTLGFIAEGVLSLISTEPNVDELADKLVTCGHAVGKEHGLWERVEGGYRIHDYETHNRSALERSEKAKKAAGARWSKAGKEPKRKPQESSEQTESMDGETSEQCSSNAQALPEQSECNAFSPSPTPVVTTASSISTVVRACPDDDDQKTPSNQVISAALDVFGAKKLARQPIRIDNPKQYLATTRQNDLIDNLHRAEQLYAANPNLTAEQLADLLDANTTPLRVPERKPPDISVARIPGPRPDCDSCDGTGWIEQAGSATQCQACKQRPREKFA